MAIKPPSAPFVIPRDEISTVDPPDPTVGAVSLFRCPPPHSFIYAKLQYDLDHGSSRSDDHRAFTLSPSSRSNPFCLPFPDDISTVDHPDPTANAPLLFTPLTFLQFISTIDQARSNGHRQSSALPTGTLSARVNTASASAVDLVDCGRSQIND